MSFPAPSLERSRVPWPGLLALLVLPIAACHAPRPDPESEAAATRALGSGLFEQTPIVFRVEGGPTDEPGADAGDSMLPLAEAVRRAATTDPTLQSALARVRIAMANADQSRLLPNPVLNLIFKFPEGSGKPSIETELTADLVAVLQSPRRVSAADQRLRAAAADAVAIAIDIAAELQERYAAVQALDELAPVLEERRRLLDKLLALATDRLDAGEGTRGDAATLQAQRVDLEVEIAQRRQERRDERLRLTRLIGQPSAPADWSVDRWQTPPAALGVEAVWVDVALANRPEVQAIFWELAALGDDAALTGLAVFDGAGAGVKADRAEGWSVGPSIRVPVPVFDFGQARRDKATAQQIEARHRLTRARRQVVEDVRRSYQSFAKAEAALARVRDELVPLQQRRRGLAEDAYRAGQTDATALFLAEQDLQASIAKRVELERASVVARVRLERAVGGAGRAPGAAAHGPSPLDITAEHRSHLTQLAAPTAGRPSETSQ